MTGLLANKVAVVTGGTSGIGRASVTRFLREGASVVIADIADEAGAALANDLGDATRYIHCDVSRQEDVAGAIALAVEQFGRLDVMYNNAGIVGDVSPMDAIDAEGFDQTFAIDVKSVLWGHKYATRQFRAQGGGGAIVTTASVAGVQGGWAPVAYTAAKHAVLGIIRQAATELAPEGIRSNAVAPGVIMTAIQAKSFGVAPERAEEFNEYIAERLGKEQAMGRFGNVDDVAKAALFLASDLASYVSGVILPVDGGTSAVTQNTFDPDMRRTVKEFVG